METGGGMRSRRAGVEMRKKERERERERERCGLKKKGRQGDLDDQWRSGRWDVRRQAVRS
jgi:hypothetical protein